MARPELHVGEEFIEPIAIEKMPYNGPGFRLEDGTRYELWSLVDTHNQPVNRGKNLQIKNSHGNVKMIPWGTMVYPLRKL